MSKVFENEIRDNSKQNADGRNAAIIAVIEARTEGNLEKVWRFLGQRHNIKRPSNADDWQHLKNIVVDGITESCKFENIDFNDPDIEKLKNDQTFNTILTRHIFIGYLCGRLNALEQRQKDQFSVAIEHLNSSAEVLGMSQCLDSIGSGSVTAMKAKALSWLGKAGADALHSKPGGSRDKKFEIRAIWATGKYATRERCAEEEHDAVGMSFSSAIKALRNTPKPA